MEELRTELLCSDPNWDKICTIVVSNKDLMKQPLYDDDKSDGIMYLLHHCCRRKSTPLNLLEILIKEYPLA